MNFENALNYAFSVKVKGFNYPSSEVYCGIPFPVELRPFPQLCTELQSCSSLESWQTSLTQCRNTCGFFCNLCNLNKGIMRRWLHVFLIFQTQWDVTMNVSCRNGCFVLRNKCVGERWWKRTTESFTLP